MPWFEYGAVRIYYEEAGRGEPVLLLPGFSESVSDHEPLRAVLADRYRVIAADLPGSGRSQPQPRAYHAGYFNDDAHALSALIRSLTDRQAHLLGFSDGGEVALLMGALYPDLARSILAWGAVGSIRDPDGKIRETFRNVVDQPAAELESYRAYLVATYGAENARAMTQSFAEAIGAIIRAGGDISRSRAGGIACPTLLIVGEHDPFNSAVLAEEYAAAIPQGSAIAVKGAGHAVHSDCGQWFESTVLDWLSKHEA